MTVVVQTLDSADAVLAAAGTYLETDVIRNNVILTLLHARAAQPEPGRYWVVSMDDRVIGLVFQSPLDFPATITPMPAAAIDAVIATIVGEGIVLPGVNGEAAAAARFAGQWTEETRSAARPVQGQRIYEVDAVVTPDGASGSPRVAAVEDRRLLIAWLEQFAIETGEKAGDGGRLVDRRSKLGQLWIWSDDDAVAVAGRSASTAGVVRIGPVYTPPEHRNRGHASALVASLAADIRADGTRCILYTDLANPTSNAIYRAIGFRAVAEALEYEFG